MLTKQIQINQQNYRLEIGPHRSQACWRYHYTKEIKVVSYHVFDRFGYYEVHPFCYPCALANIIELEEGNYEVPNKSEVVKDLRKALNS
jgi:hypothetical protein